MVEGKVEMLVTRDALTYTLLDWRAALLFTAI